MVWVKTKKINRYKHERCKVPPSLFLEGGLRSLLPQEHRVQGRGSQGHLDWSLKSRAHLVPGAGRMGAVAKDVPTLILRGQV